MRSGVIMENRNTALIILAIYLYTINSAGLGIKLLAWFILWYGTGGKYWIYLAKHTLRRDLRQVQCCQIYLLSLCRSRALTYSERSRLLSRCYVM
jgi:hypothetical protein